MTTRTALQVLIAAASRDALGAGCGIRFLPSEGQREEMREAARKVWKKAYGYEASDGDISWRFPR